MTAMPTAPGGNVVAFPTAQPPFQRGDEVELAAAARRQLQTSDLTYDEGRFWRYNVAVGIWEELGNEVINQTVAGFAGAPRVTGTGVVPLSVSSRQINGARGILRDALLADPKRTRFGAVIKGLAFANGFVVVQNGKITLEPHSAAHLARHVYPFDYNPGLATPKLDEFLTSLFADVVPQERQDRIGLYQDFGGTCLIGEATSHQVALVLDGGGNNGKSEALELARSTFPPKSVVSIPPQLWPTRFQIARLVGALANFVDEVPERDITGGELFKSVITGEPVTGEEKHQPPFEFKPVAGHIFSTNTLPGTVDQSDGYWRRFIVLPFTRDMATAPERRAKAAQSVIDAELPGIVAWFLEGAARVQRQGGYKIPASSLALVQAWRTDADSVLKFAAEECVAEELLITRPDKLFQLYCGWAKANNFAPMSSTKFYRRFSKTGIERVHTNMGNVYRCRVPDAWKYDKER